MKKLFAIFLLCAAASASAQTVVEEIVARINDRIITRSEYQKGREQLLTELKQQSGNSADQRFAEREKDILRDLIDQQLLVQRGQDLGISADTQVIKRLDEMRKQMNLDTMEELERAATAQGISFEDFKQQMRDSIITQEVIRDDVGRTIDITDAERKEYYEANQQQFDRPEQVRLSEILIAPPPAKEGEARTPEQEDEVMAAAGAKAREAAELIKKGQTFEEVARKVSSGPTAAQGGDLGAFRRGMLSKQLEDQTFAMKPGEVTGPIRTKQGWILLKVTDKSEAGIAPYKDVENEIAQQIYLKKLQPALRTYLTRLREEAYIDIKAGYVDTGASPKQSKGIVTVAENQQSDQQPKKRKKKLGIF